MAAFLAARTVSSRLAARPARVQRPQVSRPLSLKPVRGVRVVTRAVDKEKVLADVRGVIAEQLGQDVEKITPDAKFTDLGADSLDIVEIMMGLEEKFGLTFDEEGASKISTVAEAADLIAGQLKD